MCAPMRRCQPMFRLLTQEDLEKTIREAKVKIEKLQAKGEHEKVARLKRELTEFEKLWLEMVEFGDYYVDGAGVVYKKEKRK